MCTVYIITLHSFRHSKCSNFAFFLMLTVTNMFVHKHFERIGCFQHFAWSSHFFHLSFEFFFICFTTYNIFLKMPLAERKYESSCVSMSEWLSMILDGVLQCWMLDLCNVWLKELNTLFVKQFLYDVIIKSELELYLMPNNSRNILHNRHHQAQGKRREKKTT